VQHSNCGSEGHRKLRIHDRLRIVLLVARIGDDVPTRLKNGHFDLLDLIGLHRVLSCHFQDLVDRALHVAAARVRLHGSL
jgi:hypothetical protein